MNEESTAAWDSYWHGGALTSFGERFAEGYEGDLRAFWQHWIAEFPDGATLLDLGAGNGALAEIFVAECFASGTRRSLHSVELSKELPNKYVPPNDADMSDLLCWHLGVRNEETPLSAASIDGVMSNYGVEYGDLDKTLLEVDRVLIAGGRCRFLLHSKTSPIIQGAENELAVLEAQLASDGFLARARDYLTELGDVRDASGLKAKRDEGASEPLRLALNEAHEQVVAKVNSQNGVALVREVASAVGTLVSPPGLFESKQTLLSRLNEVRRSLKTNRARLQQMTAAALNEATINDWLGKAQKLGYKVSYHEQHDSRASAPIGWAVDFEKPRR